MGMQQQVVLQGQLPSWATVRDTLREHFGMVPEMRMIDGEIALPDQEPPDHWQELRVAAGDGSGMVTLKHSGNDQIDLVVWSNADLNLQQAWNHLTWVLAHLTRGTVKTNGAEHAPARFWQVFIDSS